LNDDYALPPAEIYAIYPQKQNLAARTRVFVDFLAERFARKSGQQNADW
jgi:DNA-binding transcriptional LysR family regulator